MSTTTGRKAFVNLPVKDLDKTVEFFTGLGFEFDPRFTDETATCMVLSDEAFVMFLVEARFREFTRKPVCDVSSQAEAIVALSASSREEVDELVDKALAGGGQPMSDTQDLGFMYARDFQDLDGHIWSFLHMDMSVVEEWASEGSASA